MLSQPWNRCDECGRFISYADFANKRAFRVLVTPDSLLSREEWWTAHADCAKTEHTTEERN